MEADGGPGPTPARPAGIPEGLRAGAAIEHLHESMAWELVEATGERVHAVVTLGADHHQPFGVVHGGVLCTLVEELASIGASAAVADRDQYAVGTSNTTDFLRPTVQARLDAVATPVQVGRTQQLWQVDLTRPDGKLVAQGRLRLANVPLPG